MNPFAKANVSRIGIDGLCKLLAYLKTPKTTQEVVAYMGLHDLTAKRMLRWMVQLKIAHRASWYRPAPHSRMVPMWMIGGDGDVPSPDRTNPLRPSRMHAGLVLVATTIEVLQEPTTIIELAEELQMCDESAARIIRHLRAHGLAHIASWIKPPIGVTVAQHVYGEGKDAKRPARVPAKKQAKKHRQTFVRKQTHLMMLRVTAGVPANERHAEAVA